ncbi:hypothetical protein, partial [Seonamhaeicola marinus]
MNKLQKALKINALFSGISGLVLFLFNIQISNLFGTKNNTIFLVFGLVLIYFSLTIWYEIKRQRKLAVIWIIIQDFTWVLGSTIILIFQPLNISKTGNVLIAIVALIVLFMGLNQLYGLKKRT